MSQTFNLTDLVSRHREVLSASVPRGVHLSFDLSSEELLIAADPSQIEQILTNLVVNAGEAIPPETDGRVEIATGTGELTPEVARAHAPSYDARPGPFVFLEVSDNGSGMDEATLSQIFNPFFSTKFTGRGLGLAAVQGIVRSCGGFIDVASSPGVGSRFRVCLPAAGQRSFVVPAASSLGAPVRRDREPSAILVVDDEAMVRELACAALRERGYELLEAKDGREALDVLADAARLPSLVLLDLSLPVLGAEELVPILNKKYPNVRIIISSGYTEEDARMRLPPGVAIGFLQKPYTLATLAQRVEETLRSGGGPIEEAPAAA